MCGWSLNSNLNLKPAVKQRVLLTLWRIGNVSREFGLRNGNHYTGICDSCSLTDKYCYHSFRFVNPYTAGTERFGSQCIVAEHRN